MQRVLHDIRPTLPATSAEELCSFICEFSNPDPEQRGRRHVWSGETNVWGLVDPLLLITQQYNLEYAISRFDHLASRSLSSDLKIANSFNRQKFLEFFRPRKS